VLTEALEHETHKFREMSMAKGFSQCGEGWAEKGSMDKGN